MEQITNEAAAPKRLKAGGRKPLIIAGIVLGILILAFLTICTVASHRAVFFPGSAVNGVDVAGLSAAEAAEKLERELPQRMCDIYLDTGGAASPEAREPDASVSFAELGLFPEAGYDGMVKSAFILQHGAGYFSTGITFLQSLLGKNTACSGRLSWDSARLDTAMAALINALNREPSDTSYQLDEGALQITAAKDGRHVEEGELRRAIQNAVQISAQPAAQVELSADLLPAKTLTAQEIYDAVSGEMKNAGYDAATGAITPEQAGAEFDVTAAQAALDGAAPGETVSVPAEIQQPHVTAQELKAVLFRDVLGECTTKVGGTAARISNVKLASAAFSGTVLNTGDVFSYNGATGQRTAAKGYQAAPAYVKGETVDEIGGGVCQPSSTLYYACLRANLEITERYAHRYVPSYITPGMDATVSWGGPDYKFTNNTDYPIQIVATYAKGYLTVKLLGTKTDDLTVKMTSEKLSTTPWETVYEDDPTLTPGTETVKVTPYTGYKYKTYRNLYDGNGNLISSTYEATSDYKSRNKVILRGPAVQTPVVPTDTPASGASQVPAETPSEPTPETPAETLPPTPETPPVSEEIPIIVLPEEPSENN